MRSLSAPQIGLRILSPQSFSTADSVDFLVRGTIGLIRTTGAGSIGQLLVNEGLAPLDDTNAPDGLAGAGGDIQLVDSFGDISANLLADRAIGTIRAASIGLNPLPASYFIANADLRESDGIIDLIDDAGAFNGPHLFTGPGGNVRYLHIPNGPITKSSAFGGGSDNPIVLNPGETHRLIDDSGTSFEVSPTPQVANTARLLPTDPQFLNPGNLSILTYAVDDHKGGGVVVVNITVDSRFGSGTPNHGLLIQSDAAGANGSVEIGEIVMHNDSNVSRSVIETPGA